MIKSNININSNIYIRSNPDLKKDKQYIEKITGAERIRKIKERYYGIESIKMSDVQNKIAENDTVCSYAKNGEKSFGPVMVNGIVKWENRCEYSDCPEYNITCKPDRVYERIHESFFENDSEDKNSLWELYEHLKFTNQDNTEENPKEYTAPTEQAIEEIKESNKKYIKITDSDCIISAPLNSHIILNSGPGTGKTYSIIQRLIYILKNNLCPAEEIYILCYTRSAKNVIETKIEQAVIDDIIQPSAKNICVLTFDSYASYFLMDMKEQGVITENFDNYSYNERIKLFNKYISPDDFEEISYFIVDEIQDLVNERAEMVLNILSYLKCGYLLAGDCCQSIYDYEADDDATLDSVKFYELAEKQFPNDMQRYEITVNRRQTPELAEESAKMRDVLLNQSFIEQNKYSDNVISQYSEQISIESYIDTLVRAPKESTAILCRNNGEAEYISGLLCAKGISHILNRGVNNVVPLPKWIADVFWDYCCETISRNDFIERFRFRCDSELEPDMLWQYICKLSESQDKAVINVEKLVNALTNVNNIPSYFCNNDPMLTVSTIHKAKGSEFDRVILIKSDIEISSESAEEARIRYVALTRPKTQFITMKKRKKYFKRIISGRIIETGMHYKSKCNKYCKCITVGFTGDIDNNSFVSGDFNSVLDLQEYIINNIKLYDKLCAKRIADSEIYKIYHEERCIGMLSKKMIDEIRAGVEATDYRYKLPDRLDNFYVSKITTEILKKFDANVPVEYQKSRICFGIQITGLAELKFEKK